MDSRRKLIIFICVLAFGALAALIETQTASSSNRRVSLVDSASIGAPVAPPTSSTTASPRPSTPAPPPASALFPTSTSTSTSPSSDGQQVASTTPSSTPPPPQDITNADSDLRGSRQRLDAIDSLAQDADRLFATPNLPEDFGAWTKNPQGLDQRDYQTPDGAITSWQESDEQGNSAVKAQEAQLNNGEVVDRWFNDDGHVEQVMHQYDRGNSYSVYYYPTGEVEATRVVRNGAEIFTRYDRDGKQTQRSLTPASP